MNKSLMNVVKLKQTKKKKQNCNMQTVKIKALDK